MSDPTTRPPAPAPEGARTAELGALLLQRFSAVIRIGKTHDVTNQAFQAQLRELHAVVAGAIEEDGEDELALVAVSDYFYLNGVRIKAQASLLGVYHGLMAEFERRSLAGIRFHQGVSEGELERFFQLFKAAEDETIAMRLIEATRAASIENITPVRPVEVATEDENEEQPEEVGERGRAKRVFWRSVAGTKRVLQRARQTGRPDLRQAKRVVQPVVDMIMKHEFSIVGLTAIKDHDEYTYAHCVNVSVLSIGIGQALGLPRQTLADLGVAALLHDIGKIAVSGEVLRKPAALTADEWTSIRRHPIEGVKIVTRMPGLTPLTLDTMRICLEHHMNFDRTGYPDVEGEWGQATLSRIVAVADCFDAITAHRAYHKRPRSAFEGLQYMLGPTRVGFDPAALWALVRTVGLYPAGTVLGTDSGHQVLALSPNHADLRRPHCRVLVLPDGTPARDDPAEEWLPMPPERSALRVLRPEEHGFDVSERLAA